MEQDTQILSVQARILLALCEGETRKDINESIKYSKACVD